jgi:hypothetical protein
MPRIFDNIERRLSEALQETLGLSQRADFCVGYFNLRGWDGLGGRIEEWAGEENSRCRLLVGMQSRPVDELRVALNSGTSSRLDNATALRLKRETAQDFREQLCIGLPSDQDEVRLHRLLKHLKNGRLVVKLFLRHPLHAKLYLCYRQDPVNPITAYLGSSNLTFAGLVKQGELNVDVLDHDATEKLKRWFEDRWEDRWCVDITRELIEVIEESWAREEPIPPYYIYLKIAYVLSQDARTGLAEWVLPERFEQSLFEYQKAAVKIAAHHLNQRGGVLLGDVVGLGKTLMATALASLFQDTSRILVICPKNLVSMWEDYSTDWGVPWKVMSITRVQNELPEAKRFHLVVIDESHNLRNREGKRYRIVQEYLVNNGSKVIMLSATPYNKTYIDLANQLRLFIDESTDLGISPETFIREKGELELSRRECAPRTLRAFEQSEYADDWRELMRLYLVRRTRGFIKGNYALSDPANGRNYLLMPGGERSYFPDRIPKSLTFKLDDGDPADQYAKLYSQKVVSQISSLQLPRYGLGNYILPSLDAPPTPGERKILDNLSRGGKRLMGFCRTGLFKRLESSGSVFIQSLRRHALRNFVYLHALENGLELPIGTQDVELLDPRTADDDEDYLFQQEGNPRGSLVTEDDFRAYSANSYDYYTKHARRRFKWISPRFFVSELAAHLLHDAKSILKLLEKHRDWDPAKDTKLAELHKLLHSRHPDEKVLVFTQFADTARYLEKHLGDDRTKGICSVTGDSEDPTRLAYRFSPASNDKRQLADSDGELRVLLATDVLSEGQNLQDAHIIVNYDLPWAIIRLIQRAGRVDRIGQKAEQILCYTFLPADGVERIIRLRSRVETRLTENREVVGSDETFFEGQESEEVLRNLYNERSGILDGEEDTEVDLASEAYQIWKNATDADPDLKQIVPALPPVVYSARSWHTQADLPPGAVVFVKTRDENCALAWIDTEGNSATESQYRILRAAACSAETSAVDKAPNHHELVREGVELILRERRSVHGQLGRRNGARYRTYERMRAYLEEMQDGLFDTVELRRAVQQLYDNPLTEHARDALNHRLRGHAEDHEIAETMVALYEDDRLCVSHEDPTSTDGPQLICSLGMVQEQKSNETA